MPAGAPFSGKPSDSLYKNPQGSQCQIFTPSAAGGGTIAVVGVMLFAPKLASLGLMFGPAEFFAMTAGGLLLLTRISDGSLAAGLLLMALGLMLSTIGQEAVTGQHRFTFDSNDLMAGIELVALVVGLYGVAEIMTVIDSIHSQIKSNSVKARDMMPTREEWRRCLRWEFLSRRSQL